MNSRGLGKSHSSCSIPGELFKFPEGDHGPHALAQWGEATVHEEFRAVSEQVRVRDSDRHGHPAGGKREVGAADATAVAMGVLA